MKQARDYRTYNVRLTSADWQRGSGRVISKCYKNGLCNITDWSNKFIQVSCFKYFKALRLDIMAHNHSLIARYICDIWPSIVLRTYGFP